jgi:hypothetical protein
LAQIRFQFGDQRKVKGDLIELIDCGARSERLFHQSALELRDI